MEEAAKALERASIYKFPSFYIGSNLVMLEKLRNSSCSSAAFPVIVSPILPCTHVPSHLKYYRELMSIQPLFIQGREVGNHCISALHVC